VDGRTRAGPAGPIPFVVSARGDGSLRRQARRLARHLRARPDQDLTDVAYSLATTRAALNDRAVVMGSDHEEVARALDALAAGSDQAAAAGGAVDLGAAFAAINARQVELPTYEFDRKRYWIDGEAPWLSGPPGEQAATA
jgi:acyl transferase domain-containing protein